MSLREQIREFGLAGCSVDEIAAYLRTQRCYVRQTLRDARLLPPTRLVRPRTPVGRAFADWLRAA